MDGFASRDCSYRMKSALFKVKSTISDQKVLEMVFGLEVMAQLFCCRYVCVCECNLGCLNLKCTYGERVYRLGCVSLRESSKQQQRCSRHKFNTHFVGEASLPFLQ